MKKKIRIRVPELDLKPINFLFLTLAGIINSFGITVFLSPVNLYDSGISGTSMLLAQITNNKVSLSLFLLILNIPLFLYGLKKQGKAFTVYAIYSVAIYSLGAWLITDVLPLDVANSSPFAEHDLFLCSIFGGVISGIGSGLAIKFGGAMDGIEVMAVIFSKRIGISVGTFVMGYNIILYIICGIITSSWILPLYSIITYFMALKTLDYIVEGLERSKSAIIITTEPKKISKALSETFECGVTSIEAKGCFSDQPKTMIYFIVNRFQIGKMKNIIHDIDPCAYITISEVADVFSLNNQK